MTLSIIVPVYNVREYLNKCVDSLLEQDLEKRAYEIILVDDGSTDGSGQLCDEYAIRERNIKVIHQDNQGLSVARNTGTLIAEGKYIQYVDSDDYLQPNVLRFLVSIMEDNCLDVLRFGFKTVSEWGVDNTEIGEIEFRLDEGQICDGKDFLLQQLWFSCYAWQFMIRRKILEANHLQFKPGIIFEDIEWTPRLLTVSQRVSSIELIVYYYLIREGSIMNSAVEKRVNGQLLLIDELSNQMESIDDHRWHQGMISHIVVSIISTISRSLYSQRKKYLKELKCRNIYPLSFYLAKKSGFRKILLINVSPTLTCFLIHMCHIKR